MEAPKTTGRDPTVKLAIGMVCRLAAFPLFFVVKYLAGIPFFCGLYIYFSGLIENTSHVRATKQAALAAESTKR